jgi:hypothetical protein
LHVTSGSQQEFSNLARVAVRQGVARGIEALLSCPEEERPDILEFLGNHIDLPPDPGEAWHMLEGTRGRWGWHPESKQFPPAVNPFWALPTQLRLNRAVSP